METVRLFDKDDLHRLAALRSALAASSQTDVSLPQLVALLSVAIEPGLSVNELADRIGAPQQTASRYASVLMGRYDDLTTPRSRQMREPLLEQAVSDTDPRSRSLLLTRSGKKFVADLLTLLRAKT